MEAEVVEHEVMMILMEQEAAELEEVCSLIQLDCPETAKGKRNVILKLILKHLLTIGEKEDSGFATFKIIHEKLIKIETKTEPEVKIEPKLEIKQEHFDTQNTNTIFDIQKLKDFKISGTIGGGGDKDKLSYTSLSFQIQNAKKLGYSDENICGAVIKAISASNYLRTYFESKPNLLLSSVLDVLRSHFKEKDSASTFTDLSNAVQLSTETCIDFVIRLMCLRQKVHDLSCEEG